MPTWYLKRFRNIALPSTLLAVSALAACAQVGGEATLNREWEACRQDPGGDYEASIAVCSEVIDAPNTTNVDIARALNNRAIALSRTGREQQALADFQRANAVDPQNANPFYNRGALHFASGRYDEALADITRAIALDDANAQYYNARGLAYERLNDFDNAFADYSQAIALEPQMGEWHNSRCWLRATHRRELDAALADCENALEASPNDPFYLDSRGMVHLQRREWRAAIADYDFALSQDATLAASYFGRGVAHLRLGENTEGQADLTAARRLDPNVEARFAAYGVAP